MAMQVTATHASRKFKAGDSVKYVGQAYPWRQGAMGFIKRAELTTEEEETEWEGYFQVQLDSEATPIGCYGKSLEAYSR